RDEALAVARRTGRFIPGIVTQPDRMKALTPSAFQIDRKRLAAVQDFNRARTRHRHFLFVSCSFKTARSVESADVGRMLRPRTSMPGGRTRHSWRWSRASRRHSKN